MKKRKEKVEVEVERRRKQKKSLSHFSVDSRQLPLPFHSALPSALSFSLPLSLSLSLPSPPRRLMAAMTDFKRGPKLGDAASL